MQILNILIEPAPTVHNVILLAKKQDLLNDACWAQKLRSYHVIYSSVCKFSDWSVQFKQGIIHLPITN